MTTGHNAASAVASPPAGANHEFYFPETGIGVSKQALLLAIDDSCFIVKSNLCLYLTKPQVRAEPVLGPEPRESAAPDNMAAHFYGTVLQDEGRFRMWYYACHWGANPDWPADLARQIEGYGSQVFIGPLCYAESDDGLQWTKPNLGQVTFKGSRDNNVLALPHAIVSCATVIKDETDPDPARRYKMAYQFFYDKNAPEFAGLTGFTTCAMAVSPDGLQWSVIDTPYPHDFVEHASFYQHDGKYILNSHQHSDQVSGEGGTTRGRTGFTRLAYDFDNWVDGQVESFALPEPQRVEDRGILTPYDQVHLGTGATSFGTVCIGLYGLWHSDHHYENFEAISCDFGLVISNDGLRFREPVKGHVYLSRFDSSPPPVPDKEYQTILCQANGILNVGDETRIYHGRWRNAGECDLESGGYADYHAEVGLATLPRDRWGALGLFPDHQKGHVWTAPITLPLAETQLFLNAEGANGIQVEIANERFELLSAYSGSNAGRVSDLSGLDCPVQWPEGGLSSLAGQKVRLKISLKAGEGAEPRLYALSLKTV